MKGMRHCRTRAELNLVREKLTDMLVDYGFDRESLAGVAPAALAEMIEEHVESLIAESDRLCVHSELTSVIEAEAYA